MYICIYIYIYMGVKAQEANNATTTDVHRIFVRVCICVNMYISNIYTYKFLMVLEANSAMLTEDGAKQHQHFRRRA